MPFVTFVRNANPPSSEAWVTIQARGYLSFNKAAYAQIGEPRLIEMLYDADEQLIGVRKADEANPNAMPVNKQSDSKTYIVSMRGFRTFFNLDFKESRRFPVTTRDDMLVIDLKEDGKAVFGPRSQKKASA